MNIREAESEVRRIAKRCEYRGELTGKALTECAQVYLDSCDESGCPRPRVYMRSGKEHRPTKLNEIQWLLTRTPGFKQWFGNSVVVDENGDPKVMYHGSSQAFDEFKVSAIKLSKTQMTLWSGPGFYFSDREAVAKIYAKGKTDTVYDVFLRLENPLVVDETGNEEGGRGITKKQAESIFLDGDNTQWLDSGLAAELARLDEAEGVKRGGKHHYKQMTRKERVSEFVKRIKTDVVMLKTAAQAYGARSQGKLLASVCAHTGHDGVIHTLAPELKEWVVYDPKAIKSASENNGDFATDKAKVQDAAIEKTVKGDGDMAQLVEALKKIACDCADSAGGGYKAVMDSLAEIGRRSVNAEDAIDPDGKWITVHPNGAKEGEGRAIHLDKGGNIDSEGHLSNALKGKSANAAQSSAPIPPAKPSMHHFSNAKVATEYIQAHKDHPNPYHTEYGHYVEHASMHFATDMVKKELEQAVQHTPIGSVPGYSSSDLNYWGGTVAKPKVSFSCDDFNLGKNSHIHFGINAKAMGNDVTPYKKEVCARVETMMRNYAKQVLKQMGYPEDCEIKSRVDIGMNAPSVNVSVNVGKPYSELRDSVASEMEAALKEDGSEIKSNEQIKADKESEKKQKTEALMSTLPAEKKELLTKEGFDAFDKLETAIKGAKDSGKSLETRFEVSDYEDADEHYYHAMKNLVTNLGGKVQFEDDAEYDEENGEYDYGYARGFKASFPPDVAHKLYMAITVNDGYHGEMHLPTVAK